MAGWENLESLVEEEIRQREEEGCNVNGFIEKLREAGNDQDLMVIYNSLQELPVQSDFPYIEPNGLNEIRDERPGAPIKLTSSLSDDQWKDKFYGAWLGRLAGCALGKPIENDGFMSGSHGRTGWENVKLWFEGADAWPIQNYTPEHSSAEKQYGIDINRLYTKSMKEYIQFMESDDDIRYTVVGLALLEEKGADWDTWDVGKHWHKRLAYAQVSTAETHAYLNFAQVTSHMNTQVEYFFANKKELRPVDWQEKLEWVRTYLNPYREWIGAQIRVDGLAYGAAGNPELAAEFAWRDASLSHVKNGVYGAMFISAMIAAAFVEHDLKKVVEIGLNEIPKSSRLASDIRKAIEIAQDAKDQVELVKNIWNAFNHYHPVHTNNNAALVAASLIFSKGDFQMAISTAVLGGWDTDCNGATVGSIMGAMLGANQLPPHWIKPLNDTLYSEVYGFHPITISECARRSFEVFKKINK
jgi:ADP-ribosylglycohydrolase